MVGAAAGAGAGAVVAAGAGAGAVVAAGAGAGAVVGAAGAGAGSASSPHATINSSATTKAATIDRVRSDRVIISLHTLLTVLVTQWTERRSPRPTKLRHAESTQTTEGDTAGSNCRSLCANLYVSLRGMSRYRNQIAGVQYAKVTAATPPTVITMDRVLMTRILRSRGSLRTLETPRLRMMPSANTNSGLVAMTVDTSETGPE